MLERLREDLDAVQRNDPSAKNRLETALTCLPFHAICLHRLANWLHVEWGLPFLPAALANFAKALTGVEIHPGAQIGRRFFIDHGVGVVIGETARVGDDCVLFHNVTLGGTGKHRGKRHPSLGDRVYIGTGATLLGPIQVGDDARIGAQSFVRMRDVPANTTVVGAPARIVRDDGQRVDRELPHTHLQPGTIDET